MRSGGPFGRNSIYYVGDDPNHEYPERDGSQIFVHNPSGKFFDISLVTKPADMTAYMIYGPRAFSDKVAMFRDDLLIEGYSPDFVDYQVKMAECEAYSDENMSCDPAYSNTQPQGPHLKGIETPKGATDREKLADMIKRVEGLAVGLDSFKDDQEHLSKKEASLIVSGGLETLSDTLKRGGYSLSFPETFKLAHMAVHSRMPSHSQIKMASLHQNDFLGFMLNNPAVNTFVKVAFDLDRQADTRKVSYLRKNDFGSAPELVGSDYTSTTKKEAAAAGLVAASIFIDQKPSPRQLLNGMAIAHEYRVSRRSLNTKRASLEIHDDPAPIFSATSKLFGDLIF